MNAHPYLLVPGRIEPLAGDVGRVCSLCPAHNYLEAYTC